jgi:exosortase/archaeosortase family protein
VSITNCLDASLGAHGVSQPGSLPVPRSFFWVLVLTLAAITADQLAAPILRTTSPLWAVSAWLLLVWRRGKPPILLSDGLPQGSLSMRRLTAFIAIHLVVMLVARGLTNAVQPVAGTATVAGSVAAVWKLSVLAPTVVLLSLAHWRDLLRVYAPETKAALMVLLINVPRRVLEAFWPWYGQVLGQFVYALARPFLPELGYEAALNPTLVGPDQDTTIVLACSGISGLELLGYLFGFVALLDWNRLRKRQALLIYFGGVLAMLVSNALRIAVFVVLGNRGFADFVSRFHVSAGSIFFSFVFLAYLSLTYRWMTRKAGILPTT